MLLLFFAANVVLNDDTLDKLAAIVDVGPLIHVAVVLLSALMDDLLFDRVEVMGTRVDAAVILSNDELFADEKKGEE